MDCTRSTHVTTRWAEDHTVLITVRTDSTASDINLGITTIGLFLSTIICILPSTSRLSVVTIYKLTHGAIRTTTIDVMQDGAAFNLHLRIALDQTSRKVIIRVTSMYCVALTTAIDITEVCTTLALCANRTALDSYIRIELYESALTTTKDRTLHFRISIDGHIGLARQCQCLDKGNVISFRSKSLPFTIIDYFTLIILFGHHTLSCSLHKGILTTRSRHDTLSGTKDMTN